MSLPKIFWSQILFHSTQRSCIHSGPVVVKSASFFNQQICNIPGPLQVKVNVKNLMEAEVKLFHCPFQVGTIFPRNAKSKITPWLQQFQCIHIILSDKHLLRPDRIVAGCSAWFQNLCTYVITDRTMQSQAMLVWFHIVWNTFSR